MTNFEKYRDEILAIVDQDGDVAVVNGIPRRCKEVSCSSCDFCYANPCGPQLLKWLYNEFCPLKKGDRVILNIPGQPPLRCYFAERNASCVSVFSGGRDEWSSNGDTVIYPEKYVKPYKECEETE